MAVDDRGRGRTADDVAAGRCPRRRGRLRAADGDGGRGRTVRLVPAIVRPIDLPRPILGDRSV